MGTYDVTGTGSSAGIPHDAHKRFACIEKHLKYDDLLALNATLTANGKITSGDVLQVLKLPDNFLVLNTAILAVTPEGSATTADLGLAGGDEFQDGLSLNEAAGSVELTLVSDDYGVDNVMGHALEAADTIDLTAAADIEAGEWWLFVIGVDISIH